MYLKAIDHVMMIIADVTADFVMIEEINSLSNVPVKVVFLILSFEYDFPREFSSGKLIITKKTKK